MNKPIKVLQIQPKFHVRTSDLQEEIIKALAEDKFDVTTSYLTGTPGKDEMQSICKKTKYFNISKKNLKGLRVFATFQLWRYCNEHQFDVIITHRFKPLFIMLIVNKLLKKPAYCISVLHANGEFERTYRRIITRLFVDKFWKLVGVSLSVKEDLLQYKNTGFTNENVIYINNSLDIKKISSGLLPRSSSRTKLGIDTNTFVFGTIGRLVNVKGHIYLLKAFKTIKLKFPNAQLVIIGGGKLEPQIKAFIHEHHLEQSVILTGNIFDAYQFLQAFDVFVLSSLSEGLPLVVLEAMIAKLPVIATDVGAVKDTIANQGKLVLAGNTDALTTAMQEYIQLEKSELYSLGESLRIRAENEFSIIHYRKNYRNLVLGFRQTVE